MGVKWGAFFAPPPCKSQFNRHHPRFASFSPGHEVEFCAFNGYVLFAPEPIFPSNRPRAVGDVTSPQAHTSPYLFALLT